VPELKRAEDGCKLPFNTPETSVHVRQSLDDKGVLWMHKDISANCCSENSNL